MASPEFNLSALQLVQRGLERPEKGYFFEKGPEGKPGALIITEASAVEHLYWSNAISTNNGASLERIIVETNDDKSFRIDGTLHEAMAATGNRLITLPAKENGSFNCGITSLSEMNNLSKRIIGDDVITSTQARLAFAAAAKSKQPGFTYENGKLNIYDQAELRRLSDVSRCLTHKATVIEFRNGSLFMLPQTLPDVLKTLLNSESPELDAEGYSEKLMLGILQKEAHERAEIQERAALRSRPPSQRVETPIAPPSAPEIPLWRRLVGPFIS